MSSTSAAVIDNTVRVTGSPDRDAWERSWHDQRTPLGVGRLRTTYCGTGDLGDERLLEPADELIAEGRPL